MKRRRIPKERRKKERNKYGISTVLWNFVGERDKSYFSPVCNLHVAFGQTTISSDRPISTRDSWIEGWNG